MHGSTNFMLLFVKLIIHIWKLPQVMRGGRMVKISIYDIVVGDVVPLRIGDQVSIFMFELVLVGTMSFYSFVK